MQFFFELFEFQKARKKVAIKVDKEERRLRKTQKRSLCNFSFARVFAVIIKIIITNITILFVY